MAATGLVTGVLSILDALDSFSPCTHAVFKVLIAAGASTKPLVTALLLFARPHKLLFFVFLVF